jgi:hypothetical protein
MWVIDHLSRIFSRKFLGAIRRTDPTAVIVILVGGGLMGGIAVWGWSEVKELTYASHQRQIDRLKQQIGTESEHSKKLQEALDQARGFLAERDKQIADIKSRQPDLDSTLAAKSILERELSESQAKLNKYQKEDEARKSSEARRYAAASDSFQDAVKHLDMAGVPADAAITILRGRYTLVAEIIYSPKGCKLTITDTTASEDDKGATQTKTIPIGKGADFQIDGKTVFFLYRFSNGNACAFDVKVR